MSSAPPSPRQGARRPRRNQEIRISPVRVIGADGTQLGVLPVDEARRLADAAGLDLVEVAAQSRPPVCRIMDYGKHVFEEGKRARAARRAQATSGGDLKEVQLRPNIDPHDLDIKMRRALGFLEEGHRVRIVLRFRGREITHRDIGERVLESALTALAPAGSPQGRPSLEGKQMSVLVLPRRGERGGRGREAGDVAAARAG